MSFFFCCVTCSKTTLYDGLFLPVSLCRLEAGAADTARCTRSRGIIDYLLSLNGRTEFMLKKITVCNVSLMLHHECIALRLRGS